MYCKNCGKPVKDGSNFCGVCGQPLDDSFWDRQEHRDHPDGNSGKLGPILSILLIYPVWAGVMSPLWHWIRAHIVELYDIHRASYLSGLTTLQTVKTYVRLCVFSLGEIYFSPRLLLVLLFWAMGTAAAALLIKRGWIRLEAVTWRDGVLVGALTLLPGIVRCLGVLLWMRHMGMAALWGAVYGMGVEWLMYLPHLHWWLLVFLLLVARSGRIHFKKAHVIITLAILMSILILGLFIAHPLLRLFIEPFMYAGDIELFYMSYASSSCFFLWLRALFDILLAYWTGKGRVSLAGGLTAIGVTAGSAFVLGPIWIFWLHFGVVGAVMAASLAYIPGLLALFLAALIRKRRSRSALNRA